MAVAISRVRSLHSFTRLERAAVASAPLPTVVALVLPGVVAWNSHFAGAHTDARTRLTEAGIVLSAVLAAACGVIALRRRRETGVFSTATLWAAFVAGVPLLLYGLVLLLWTIESLAER